MKYTNQQILNLNIAIEFHNKTDYNEFCDSINWGNRTGTSRYPIKTRFNSPGVCNYMCVEDHNYKSYYESRDYVIIQYEKNLEYELY